MVIKDTDVPIAMLFLVLRDGGFSKFEDTPGGGFNAGVAVAMIVFAGVNVDISSMSITDRYLWWDESVAKVMASRYSHACDDEECGVECHPLRGDVA